MSSGEAGEEEPIQLEQDLPDEDDVEQEDDNIGTTNEFKTSPSGVEGQGVNQNNSQENPEVHYNLPR